MEISSAPRTAPCQQCGRVRYFATAASAASAAPAGRICRAKIAAAALAAAVKGFTGAQIAAAREIIADGAAVALRKARAYRVVSSDGSAEYISHPDGCNCPNGLRRLMPRPCKHMLAVRILVAARASR